MTGGFEAFYASPLQGLYALLPVPALFLLWWLADGRGRIAGVGRDGACFVSSYCGIFALETLLDPIAGGPVAQWLGVPALSTAIVFLFVWLGDFRVLLLVFVLGGAERPALNAAVWTFVVPAIDLLVYFGLMRALWPEVPEQTLWLVHELAFLGLAIWIRARLLPALAEPGLDGHRVFLERALAYVALYYALWAAADVLILAGLDVGWGLRVIPNQLYYAFWVPFVALSFTSRR